MIIRPASELSDDELDQLNAAVFREWEVPPHSREQLADRTFFFLKANDEILAMGGLKKVEPVVFDDETFSLLGLVEVVANIKAQGYGKQVVVALREHCRANGTTSIGFTMPHNIGFYEKCGFQIETDSTPRFVFTKEGQRRTDQDGQVIFYQDASDQFMEKVLASPKLEVSLPTADLW